MTIGRDYTPIPGQIRSWEELDGVFYGTAVIFVVFALVAVLAYFFLQSLPSLAVASSVLSYVGIVVGYDVEMWMDGVLLIGAMIGTMALVHSIALVKRKRLLLLTEPLFNRHP